LTVRVIIAGSRWIGDQRFVDEAVSESGFTIDTVVSGGARGVDRLGERWSKVNGTKLSVFPADWAKYGNAAGPIRNRQMGDYADALIAVWDGKSSGTKDMIDYMKKLGKPVYVKVMGDR